MLLNIRDIRVNYNKLEAIKSVSIQVQEGSIVTIIGANGAGKTTLLKTISGLKKPTSGEVWLEGKPIGGRIPSDIVGMGMAYCLEGRRLFPFMTVRDNLLLGAYLRQDGNEIERDLKDICQRFPMLEERQNQQAGTLSGGQQQIAAIARALMSKPKLLLMDEPSLGLAPLMTAHIAEVIRQINRRGVSIVLVEQNANMALRLADYAYLLEMGTVAFEGPSEVFLGNEHVKRVYLGM